MTILKKLKSKTGESLVESLAAILIFTMASIILFSMVMAAGDINLKSKERDAENQQQLLAVEKGDHVVATGVVDIKLGDNLIESIGVGIYGGEEGDDSLFSFFMTVPETTAGGD